MNPVHILAWIALAILALIVLLWAGLAVYAVFSACKRAKRIEQWRKNIQVGDACYFDSKMGYVKGVITELYPDGRVGFKSTAIGTHYPCARIPESLIPHDALPEGSQVA